MAVRGRRHRECRRAGYLHDLRPLEASMRVRYLGEYPLIEDNSLRADAETSLNLRGAWKAEHFTVYAELLNALDEDGKDIVYYYGAHVAGLDPKASRSMVASAGSRSRARSALA